MSDEQGSSSAGANIPPYLDNENGDENGLPTWQELHKKTSDVEKIRKLYRQQGWAFTGWHVALFYMFPIPELKRCCDNPELAWYYGEGAELFATILVPGRIPKTYTSPIPRPTTMENLTPASESIHLEVPKTSGKSGDDQKARGGRMKRRASLSEQVGALKKRLRRPSAQSLFKIGSSSNEVDPDASSDMKTEPPLPLSPSDKGKLPMTRSVLAAPQQLDTPRETTASPQESPRQAITMPDPSSSGPTVKHEPRKLEKVVDGRDHKRCVVTNRGKAVDRAHIVPFSANAEEANQRYLPHVFDIAECFFGESFRGAIESLVGDPGSSDHAWNVVTLTPFLHRMWDKYGLVGFQPRYVYKEENGPAYSVVFTFHWLLKNGITAKEDDYQCPLGETDCQAMVAESAASRAEKPYIFETVYTPHRDPSKELERLSDGKVCEIKLTNQKDADKMMKMLRLRWAASRLYCLAGAAGDDFLDSDDDDSDSDKEGFELRRRAAWGSDADET